MPGLNAPPPMKISHGSLSEYGASRYFQIRPHDNRKIFVFFYEQGGFPSTHQHDTILNDLEADPRLNIIVISDVTIPDNLLPSLPRTLLCNRCDGKVLHNGEITEISDRSPATSLFQSLNTLGVPITEDQAHYLNYLEPTNVGAAQPLPRGIQRDADLPNQDHIAAQCLGIHYSGDNPIRIFFYMLPTSDTPTFSQQETDHIGNLCKNYTVVLQSYAELERLLRLDLTHPIVLHSINDRKVAIATPVPVLDPPIWEYLPDNRFTYAATEQHRHLAQTYLPCAPHLTAHRIAAYHAILNAKPLNVPNPPTPEQAAILASVTLHAA